MGFIFEQERKLDVRKKGSSKRYVKTYYNSSSGGGGGAAGGAIAGICVCIIGVAAVWYFCCRKSSVSAEDHESKSSDGDKNVTVIIQNNPEGEAPEVEMTPADGTMNPLQPMQDPMTMGMAQPGMMQPMGMGQPMGMHPMGMAQPGMMPMQA